MGTDGQFYFVAIGTTDVMASGEELLEGVDFHGGLSSATLRRVTGLCWIIDNAGNRKLLRRLGAVHRQSYGHQLAIHDQPLPVFPCLFTTNSTAHSLYSGAVAVSASDERFEFDSLPESGISLLGTDWLGVLSRRGAQLSLDAYAMNGGAVGRTLIAYCPDWNDGFDEQDGLIFTVDLIDRDT